MDNKPTDEELWPENPPEPMVCIFHGLVYKKDPDGKKFCPICRADKGVEIECRRCGTLFFIPFGGSENCPKCKTGHIQMDNPYA